MMSELVSINKPYEVGKSKSAPHADEPKQLTYKRKDKKKKNKPG